MADPLSAKAAEADRPPPAYEETFSGSGQTNASESASVDVPTSNGQNYDQQNDSNWNRETNVNNNNTHNIFVRPRHSKYGPYPLEMDCPYCQCHIVSHIDRVAGLLPWILFGICAVLGFVFILLPWFFCCLPFCLDQCLDVIHSCPVCKRHLGRFNRI